MVALQDPNSTSLSYASQTSRLRLNDKGKWIIHYSEPQPNGSWRSRTQSTGTTDSSKAQAALFAFRRYEAEAITQATIDRYTIEELCDHYVEHHAYAKGPTATRTLKPVRHELGHLVPHALTPAVILAYRRKRNAVVKDVTVRRELSALIAALNYTKKHKLITEAPHIDLPPEGTSRVLAMTEEQEAAFWRAAMTWQGFQELDSLSRSTVARIGGKGWRLKLFAAIALATGARAEAIRDLTWDRVDLQRRIIDFQKPGVQTKKRRVAVPIFDRLYDVLIDAAVVQPDPKAKVVGRGSMRDLWAAFTKEIDMAWVTPHVCRHTFATLALARGVSLAMIADFMGDTMQTVMRNYVHLTVDHLRTMDPARKSKI